MFDVHAYLRAEFRRYYPDADRIDVHVTNEGETYDVGVVTMGGSHIRSFHMDVGSDDDMFTFTNTVSGDALTIPFAPEMSEVTAILDGAA